MAAASERYVVVSRNLAKNLFFVCVKKNEF